MNTEKLPYTFEGLAPPRRFLHLDLSKHEILLDIGSDSKRLLHVIDTSGDPFSLTIDADGVAKYLAARAFGRGDLHAAPVQRRSALDGRAGKEYDDVLIDICDEEGLVHLLEKMLISEMLKASRGESGNIAFPLTFGMVYRAFEKDRLGGRISKFRGENQNLSVLFADYVYTVLHQGSNFSAQEIVAQLMWEMAGLHSERAKSQSSKSRRKGESPVVCRVKSDVGEEVAVVDALDRAQCIASEIQLPYSSDMRIEVDGDHAFTGYASFWQEPPYKVTACMDVPIEKLPQAIAQLRKQGLPLRVEIGDEASVLTVSRDAGAQVNLNVLIPRNADLNDVPTVRRLVIGDSHRGNLSIKDIRNHAIRIVANDVDGDVTVQNVDSTVEVGTVTGAYIRK